MFNKFFLRALPSAFQPIFPLLIIYSCHFSVASAATVIKIQDGNDVTTMLTDGERARIDMSADEYVIVDFASQKINMVSPSKKQVMVFDAKSRNTRPGVNRSMVKMMLNNRGKPRNIAGFHSDRYEYTANGKSCGVVYASKSALKEKGVKQLLDTMQVMIEQQRTLMGGFAALIDDCKLADMELTGKVASIGVPMMKEENSRVSTQVKSIDVDVTLPAEIFLVPAGYTRTTIEKQVQQAYKSMPISQKPPEPARQAHSNMSAPMSAAVPQQIPRYMQQFQQSGQLSPEMMEQMRRAQGRMQQYQQR